MIEYLDLEDLLTVAKQAVNGEVLVGDYGLLESGLARPRASVFGQDAYRDLFVKAAALLHSLATTQSLIDGNKRLAWAACLVFLGLNEEFIDPMLGSEQELFDLVMAVARNEQSDLEKIAELLRYWCAHWHLPERAAPLGE